MPSPTVFSSHGSPLGINGLERTSVSEFMTTFNPDDVDVNKVVHTDTIAGKSITYGGLRAEAAKCARGLQEYGLKEGDVVAVILPNSTDFVLLAHSIWWAGGVFSPISTASTAKDLAHAFNIVNPTHVAVCSAHLSKAQEGIRLSKVGKAPPRILSVLDRIEGLPKFPEDFEAPSVSELPPYSLGKKSAKETAAVICFSSGTTGKVKGVQLSHYNLCSNMTQYRASGPLRNNAYQREVFFVPYCHIYGLMTAVLLAQWLGQFTCAIPAFDLELFCQKMEEYKATMAHIVPPVALILALSDSPLKYDLSGLEYVMVAAAPLKKALQMKLKTRFSKAAIHQGYGLSECSPAVLYQLESDEESVGTCGRLCSGTEGRLVDPKTGKDVGEGEEGELWVRGPQVMMGYIGDEEATRNTFEGDWLKTGDIFRVDKKGNFWITDRLKEMIKYKGFQIAPSELEDLLLTHPHVTDAAVCAIYNDSLATEVPLAYVSLTPEYAELSDGDSRKQQMLDGVKKWIDGRVAGYKRLRGGVFHLQVLPKSSSGKILRRELPAKIREGRGGRL